MVPMDIPDVPQLRKEAKFRFSSAQDTNKILLHIPGVSKIDTNSQNNVQTPMKSRHALKGEFTDFGISILNDDP